MGKITYPASAYYMAMFVNFICRIAWAVSLYPASFGIVDALLMHYIKLPLNLVEIFRRCLWNIFRIENEHLNNCGGFRVVEDVPIASDFESVVTFKTAPDKKQSISTMNTLTSEQSEPSKNESVDIDYYANNIVENDDDETIYDEDDSKNDDDDVLNDEYFEMYAMQQRAATISDRQSVVLNNNNANDQLSKQRNVKIMRPSFEMHSSTELDSELSTSSSSNAQIHRDRIPRNNGYMKVPLQKKHINDEQSNAFKKKKSKKYKKKRREGQESEMKTSNKQRLRPMKIHRIRTDETSSENLNDIMIDIPTQKQINLDKIAQTEDKFVRKRMEKNVISPTFSEDSEMSETDSFTHKTWPKRDWNSTKPTPQKRELSQIKSSKIKKKKKFKPASKKKKMTTNITKISSTSQSTELTAENLKKLSQSRRNSLPYTSTFQKSDDDEKNFKRLNKPKRSPKKKRKKKKKKSMSKQKGSIHAE